MHVFYQHKSTVQFYGYISMGENFNFTCAMIVQSQYGKMEKDNGGCVVWSIT